MRKFEPTHRIGKDLYMAFDGGFYTFSEWSRAEACDYSFSDDGDLLFQGEPSQVHLYSVTQLVTDVYGEMIRNFEYLLRYDWTEVSPDLKERVFFVFGRYSAGCLFDPQPFIDHFVNL